MSKIYTANPYLYKGRPNTVLFKINIAFIFISLFINLTVNGQSQAKAPLKNVIVIVGDDHAAYALGCYGSKIAHTPNLDKMAAGGALFAEAFDNSPLCTPSRQSFITGKMPHAAGVTLLNTALSDTAYTIPEHLRRHGFVTGAVGKTHFNSNLSHGFDYTVLPSAYGPFIKNIKEDLPTNIRFRNTKNPWTDSVRVWWNADGLPGAHFDKNDIGTFFANKANEFIEANKDKRFCLWVGFLEPHSPFNFPIEYKGRYNPANMPLPAGGPEDDRWIPSVFKPLSVKDRKGIIRSYYTSVSYMDKNVGLILDKVAALHLDKQTLIIYLGDNGYLLNHHKRFEKHTMWEEAIRIPLIIKAGGLGKPVVVKDMVELVDLAPTIMDALGIKQMPGMHGNSMLSLLTGKPGWKKKKEVFSEYLPDNTAMIRSEHYKYVFTNGKRDLDLGYVTGHGPAGIHEELYDLQKDPHETTSLAHKAAYSMLLKDMRQRMLASFRRTHPRASAVPQNIDIIKQLTLFCEPPEGEHPGDY